MAEIRGDSQTQTPAGPDDDNLGEQGRLDVQDFSNLVWTTIIKFVNDLTEEEIAEAEFCGCVNSIIEVYKKKVKEVKTLHYQVDLLKNMHRKEKDKVKQLEASLLASSICKHCGEKNYIPEIAAQLDALSMQDGSEPTHGGGNDSVRRGAQAMENAEASNDKKEEPLQNEESSKDETDFPADNRCPHASCGFDALMFVLHKIRSGFCAVKLMQKFGALTRNRKPTCTKILNTLNDLHFFSKIYKCENVQELEGGHKEALKIVKKQLEVSVEQKLGLLSYSTEFYNHCVAVYISDKDEPQLKFFDRGNFIESFQIAIYLELIVLKCDKNGEALISKEWKKYCHSDICKQEFKNLSQPQGNEIEPSSSNQVDHVLNERSVEFDQV